MDRHSELPLKVVERCVEGGLRRLLALDRAEAGADLLHRERVVADEVTVGLDESESRLGGFTVALDRRSLPASLGTVVMQGDVDDVGPVLRLAADDERLREYRRTISARTSI